MISHSVGSGQLRWVAVLIGLSTACSASNSHDPGASGTGGRGDGSVADVRPVGDGSGDSETGSALADAGGISTGGITGSATGGITGSATGGITGSATGGITGSATGGITASATGGITASATGGITASATGGSVGTSNSGGAPGSGGRRADGGISGQAGLGGAAGRPAGGESGTLPPGCALPTTVGFQKDVQPFLMKSCGSMGSDGCHVIDGASTMSS